MANRNRLTRELESDLGPAYEPSNTAGQQTVMSSRNKRGANRNNNGGTVHGEEASHWETAKQTIEEVVQKFSIDEEILDQLLKMDKEVGALEAEQVSGKQLKDMEDLCRKGTKNVEDCQKKLQEAIVNLEIIKGVVDAQAAQDAQLTGMSSRRGGRGETAATAALYDFDGAGESPGPSPLGGSSSRKYGERASARDREREREKERERDKDRDRERDSIPPKADSVEPQGSVGSGAGGSSGTNRKIQTLFAKGDSVAFRPAASADPGSDWILGKVAQVIGEGKARRYKVLDVEPEDPSKQKEYRTTAKSMIAITPASQAKGLAPWEAGQVVLALYPQTTTFYRAEVHSMEDEADTEEGEEPKVNLKFEGENDQDTMQQVERRFVIEYRP